MKLPWVSRLAYEIVTDERDRLRDKNDRLESAVVAIQRKANGLPELPRERAAHAQRPEELPDELTEAIAGFDSEAHRRGLEEQARRLRASGHEWPSIIDAVLAETGGVEEALEAETVGV